ncbi:hypothetical protein [Salinispora fenicalii]|uniref:hypothetical protein n=1 Tax=Salinispora fenicalii TaxID=1137263 RepID=UPI000480FFB1|nr:hypothetical protein [Salinispora fenicalii]
MTLPVEPDSGLSRRAALAKARQSRRPSRLGQKAGATATPDHPVGSDAGFPGLLNRVWQQAVAAANPAVAVETLLTLDGHVPAEIQLRALPTTAECAIRVLFGRSWRDDDSAARHPDRAGTAFLGEVGLTRSGRIAVRVPSQGPLTSTDDLVGGVLRVPWSTRDLAAYQAELTAATTRLHDSVADCRRWLAEARSDGREKLLAELTEAVHRTAPVVFYCGDRQYTNFRDRNTLTGKTLWPGHPDCALSALVTVPLDLWSDDDVLLVVSLTLLVRSAGYARIEEANGTQLTLDHVAHLLERTRVAYNEIPGGAPVPPATSTTVTALDALAVAIARRRREISTKVQLYRDIHGPLMHKIERVAGPATGRAQRAEAALSAHLRDRLPITGGTLRELGAAVAASPDWLAEPQGDFRTGLESLVYETVAAATTVFEADFAMSRGMRSLTRLIAALRDERWDTIVSWDIPHFFCCVVPAPAAGRHFGGSAARLADAAWSMSARMQYNSWHFLAGSLPPVPAVVDRDYFAPPTIPDLAYHSDQHHHGHVAAQVRFSIRSPQPVAVLDRTFTGFVDLRLLRCAGHPFDEQDLLAAHRASDFIATATTQAAALVAAGTDLEVAAFDSQWHWANITGQ